MGFFGIKSESGKCGENLRWELFLGTLTISGTGKMDDYYVDANIVWLSSKKSIKRVIVADGVTSIGDSAFYECENLTSVTIGESVMTIGDFAFSWCKNLTSVTIGESVMTIGDSAFSCCKNLTSVTIPDSVTSIGDSAFSCCISLTSVTIPDSVTSIGDWAFYGGTSLTSVTIPDSVTSIGDSAFSWCDNLKEIHYPAGRGFEKILSDGNNAKLIPYTVTPTVQPVTKPIIQAAKSGTCGKNLRWKLDGDTLTISGTGKMDDYDPDTPTPWNSSRELIRHVMIADKVTTIGDRAFTGCESLTSVTIPDSVITIGISAFSWCDNLKEIHYPAGRGFEKNLLQFNNAKLIPYNVATPVKSTTQPSKSGKCGRNVTWLLSGDTLTISGTGKMDDYSYDAKIEWLSSKESIKRVIVADGVTSIGDSAFYECENLTSVTIGESVMTIGDYAFCSCQRLKSVTIGNSVTTIGNGAFSGTSLRSVTIPDSITTIGISAFSWCDNLKEIHYPAGRGFEKILSDGNNAKLIPYNVTPPVTKPTVQPKFHPVQPTKPQPKFYPVQPTVQPVAEKLTWSFAGKTLTVGGVREIKFFPYAQIPWLKHLHDIQRIVVGDGVEKIAAQAFEECKRLELVTLPASVKTIGDMFASVAFCGDRFVNGGRNVFWCLEDGVLVLKKNPAAVGDDFSTGFASWIFADKNIRGVKLETGIKPTENFFAWLSSHDGAAISFG